MRIAAEGVKAKWVRIELRKIETLPGGGVANTFFDFVGQSPINVWQAREEYGVLHAVSGADSFVDCQFECRHCVTARFPLLYSHPGVDSSQYFLGERRYVESPTPHGEHAYNSVAGIKYELIASVCIKGKK